MPKLFKIHIDGESYEAPQKIMTANEILSLGGLSTDQHYLIEIKGNHQVPYKDQGEKEIHLHEGSKFISVFTGPTPVADNLHENTETALTGAKLFAAQLNAAGYDVTELPDQHLKFPYSVKVGKFAGLELEIGFVVPADFPLTPPHGPHISKLLHPNQSGGTHPNGGIHTSPKHSKHFGAGWQHWSRPHPDWSSGPRNAVRYMRFIDRLWASQ